MQSYTLQNQNHNQKKSHDLKISINYKIISFHFNSINQISFDSIEPNTHKIFSDFWLFYLGWKFIYRKTVFIFILCFNTPFKINKKNKSESKGKTFFHED